MISTVEILSGSANIVGRYQKPPVAEKPSFLHSPLFYNEPTFFALDQQKSSSLSSGMDAFLRPKPKHMATTTTTMKSLPHFPPINHSQQEQKDPVNLALFQPSRNLDDDFSDQKEIDVVGMDNNTGNNSSSSYSSSLPAILRAPKASYPKITEPTYQHFNFNNFATSEPYSSHLYPQLTNHSIMAQIDFRSYLTNTKFTPKHRQSLNVSDLLSTSTPQSASDFCQTTTTSYAGVQFQSYLPKNCDGNNTTTNEMSNTPNYFKMPTAGKESTLKHRILSSNSSTTRSSVSSLSSNHKNISSNHHQQDEHNSLIENDNSKELISFIRGSLIELSNGTLRKVEELRTEDFVMSAEKSEYLQIEDSTVVRIQQPTKSSNFVIITFSYENNKSKIDIEAKIEHPFFVYGQGWKSFHPEGSYKALKLDCQKLQVGDICLSLKPRKLNGQLNLTTKSQIHNNHHQHYNLHNHHQHHREPSSNVNETRNTYNFKEDYEYKKRRWSASEVDKEFLDAAKKTKMSA